MRLLVFAAALALAGCSAATDAIGSLPGAPASGPPSSAPTIDVTGTWEGPEWGPMRLTQDETGAVTGTLADYDYRTTISGTVSGNRFTGTWVAPDGNYACDTALRGSVHHGRIEFEFAGDTFQGRYSDCTAAPNYFAPVPASERGAYVEGRRVR